MIRPSFVPPPPIRLLRDLTRYRADLVNTRTAEKNRVEELLEDARIKLSVVASDIFGVSGREMMAALIAGERNPAVLAQLARTGMRAKIPRLEQAFVGRFTEHHAFLLATMLARIDEASADIAAVETRIEELIAPFARAVERLDEITGVVTTAAHVIAEIGVDMSRFPTAAHLCSWAPVRPRGQGISREEHRPRSHGHGKKRAIVAVGRSILTIIWHLLSEPDARYHDLGPGFYDNSIGPDRRKRIHIHQLEALGYKVTLEPAA
jgi:transposase